MEIIFFTMPSGFYWKFYVVLRDVIDKLDTKNPLTALTFFSDKYFVGYVEYRHICKMATQSSHSDSNLFKPIFSNFKEKTKMQFNNP